jgi:hypothetical protein
MDEVEGNFGNKNHYNDDQEAYQVELDGRCRGFPNPAMNSRNQFMAGG